MLLFNSSVCTGSYSSNPCESQSANSLSITDCKFGLMYDYSPDNYPKWVFEKRDRERAVWDERMQRPPRDLVRRPPSSWRRTGSERMLVPTPVTTSGVIADIPRGRVVTVSGLRRELARRCGVDLTCPMTIARQLVVIEHARWAIHRGKVAPSWRVVTDAGQVYPKYHCGGEVAANKLEREGVRVRHAPPFDWFVVDHDHLLLDW